MGRSTLLLDDLKEEYEKLRNSNKPEDIDRRIRLLELRAQVENTRVRDRKVKGERKPQRPIRTGPRTTAVPRSEENKDLSSFLDRMTNNESTA